MQPRKRNPQTIHLPVTFQAMPDQVEAIFHISGSTIGIRFDTVDHLFFFITQLIDKAAEVWPDDEVIKFYVEHDHDDDITVNIRFGRRGPIFTHRAEGDRHD